MEHVMSCLRALFTLLEAPSAKIHIAEDQVKTHVFSEKKYRKRVIGVRLFSELHIQFDI